MRQHGQHSTRSGEGESIPNAVPKGRGRASGKTPTAPDNVRALYASIVESSSDAIAGFDKSGRITCWNAGAESLLGLAAHEAIGRAPAEVLDSAMAADLARRVEEVSSSGRLMVYSAGFWDRDGAEFAANVTLIPIRDHDGAPIGVGAIIRAAANRARELEEIQQVLDGAQKASKLKSLFLANMSHEIRTPLNVILGYTELIGEHLLELNDSSQTPYVESVARAARRLMTTIDRILDYARIEAEAYEVKPVEIELGAMVRRVASEHEVEAARKRLEFTVAIDASEVIVRIDEYCLANALGDLISNAIKFTDHGSVKIRVARGSEGDVVVKVIDTGVGIDDDFQDRAFEAFSQEHGGYSRPFEGSGLGLALAHRYLAINGARLAMESEKNRGSTFTIKLPRDLVITPDAKATPKARVLIVEDDDESRELMRYMLAPRYDSILVASGCDICKSIDADLETADCVVVGIATDLRCGIHSPITFLRSQPRFARTPIIAVIDMSRADARRRDLAMSCNRVLDKPASRAQLFAAIDEEMEKAAAVRSRATLAPNESL
jgi:PAS domain S-box-containing protein